MHSLYSMKDVRARSDWLRQRLHPTSARQKPQHARQSSVRQSLDAKIPVVALPGPSAVTAALISSGAPASSFTFVGFPPRKLADRKRWCEVLVDEPRTLIFFESPHRLITTLKLMRVYWGDRTVALCREMTKMHEELVVQPISRLIGMLGPPRGEYTCIVWPASEQRQPARRMPTF